MFKAALRARLSPFPVRIAEPVLEDLQRRLAGWRPPPEPAAADWRYGMPVAELAPLVERWRCGFDWRSVEQRIGRFESLRLTGWDGEAPGAALHLLAAPAAGAAAGTILLCHGWPSTFLDYLDCAELLRQPGADGASFNVVLVSLPGYGFSTAPAVPIAARGMAGALAALLGAIDGPVVVHGNDWGASAASWLAADRPDLLAGLHLGMMGLKPALDRDTLLSEAERAWLGVVKRRLADDGGYAEVQSTVPSTLAVGLADSPAAVLAWIAEKYRRWATVDPEGQGWHDVDAILAQATLFWATNSLATANWVYWADRRDGSRAYPAGASVPVPTGFTFCEQGFFPPPPPEWTARVHQVVFREVLPAGGHFGAWLQPQAYAASIRRFATGVFAP